MPIGILELEGIPPAQNSSERIVITFDLDNQGILNVTVKDVVSSKQMQKTMKDEVNSLSKEELARMVGEAQRFQLDDQTNRERCAARNQLEDTVFSFQDTADDVKAKCAEVFTWMETNSTAEKSEIEVKQKEFENSCNQIMEKKIKRSVGRLNSGPGADATGTDSRGGEGQRRIAMEVD